MPKLSHDEDITLPATLVWGLTTALIVGSVHTMIDRFSPERTRIDALEAIAKECAVSKHSG